MDSRNGSKHISRIRILSLGNPGVGKVEFHVYNFNAAQKGLLTFVQSTFIHVIGNEYSIDNILQLKIV